MRRSIVATAIAIPVLVVAFFAAGYISDEVAGTPRVSRGVTALDIDLSRMTVDEATAAIVAYESSLVSQPLAVVIEGNELALSPSGVGFAIEEDAIVSEAMAVRRSSGLVSNFRSWLGTLTSTTAIEIPTSINEEATESLLDGWTSTVVETPAREGGVKIVNGGVVAEYSRAGIRIDVAGSIPLILEQLSRSDRSAVLLPLVELDALLIDADVDLAVAEAAALIDSPVVLTARGQDGTVVYTSAGLTTALRSETTAQSHAAIEVYLDGETLRDIALRSATSFIIPPIEATFVFDEETRELEVVPSVVGQKVDLDAIPDVVIAAAMSTGRGVVPMTGRRGGRPHHPDGTRYGSFR